MNKLTTFPSTGLATFRYYGILIVAMVATGCASNPSTIDSVAMARATINRVENLPFAGEVAADEVEQAHAALRNAEELAKNNAGKVEINHAAYLALRHAEIAEQQIATAEFRKIVTNAESEREKVLLQARAQRAAEQANQLNQRAQMSEQEAQQAKARAALLERQLADLNAKKTERGMVLTLGDVLFDSGKSALKPGAQSTIQRLAEFLKNSPESGVLIEGHTDSQGSEAFNMTLSQQRADSVRSALLNRNVASERVAAVGKGETTPVASNDTTAGRQQNRRVEIVIQNEEQASSR